MRAVVETEIKRILPLIPKEPPENSIEILKKRGFLKNERLLYWVEYATNLEGKKKKWSESSVRIAAARHFSSTFPGPRAVIHTVLTVS